MTLPRSPRVASRRARFAARSITEDCRLAEREFACGRAGRGRFHSFVEPRRDGAPGHLRQLLGKLVPDVGIDGNAEAHVLFAQVEGLLAGIADWLAGVDGFSLTEMVEDAVGDAGELFCGG